MLGPIGGMPIRGDFLFWLPLLPNGDLAPPPPRRWIFAAPFERVKHVGQAGLFLGGYPLLNTLVDGVMGFHSERLQRWSRNAVLASTALGVVVWAGLTIADLLTTGGTGTLIATALGGGKIAAYAAAAAETTRWAATSVAAYLGAGPTATAITSTATEFIAAGAAAGASTWTASRALSASWGFVKGSVWGLGVSTKMLGELVTSTPNLFPKRAAHRTNFIKRLENY